MLDPSFLSSYRTLSSHRFWSQLKDYGHMGPLNISTAACIYILSLHLLDYPLGFYLSFKDL